MGYVRAGDILPKEILELVQQYADGQTIYIPRRSESHKSWGAGTETRKSLMLRNSKMYEEYKRERQLRNYRKGIFSRRKAYRE